MPLHLNPWGYVSLVYWHVHGASWVSVLVMEHSKKGWLASNPILRLELLSPTAISFCRLKYFVILKTSV
jgi:hypothetical protein